MTRRSLAFWWAVWLGAMVGLWAVGFGVARGVAQIIK